jgi:hypothetical protein
MVGVEQQEKAVVDDRRTVLVDIAEPVAVEEHGERLGEAVAPVLLAHVSSVGTEPMNVADVAAVQRPALVPAAAAEHRVLLPQVDQPTGELEQAAVG